MIVGTVAFSESILNDLKPSMGAQASKTQPALSQQTRQDQSSESRPRPHSAIIASPTNLRRVFQKTRASSIHSSCSGSCSASVNTTSARDTGLSTVRGSVVGRSKAIHAAYATPQRLLTAPLHLSQGLVTVTSTQQHDGQGRRSRGDQRTHPKPHNDNAAETGRAAR